MILRTFGFLALFAILAVGRSPADDAWVLREDGIGPVKIGVGLRELNTILQERFRLPAEKDDRACFYVKPKHHPHVAFMILDGRLARIDVDGGNISTTGGIHVGDSEMHTLRVYGSKLKVEPSQYTGPEGHYLTLRSTNGRYGIRFETDDSKITQFYAGRFDAIQLVEGCE
jgi:hypothetical protein